MFCDAGAVSIDRNQCVVGAANTRNIADNKGLGANIYLAGIQIKAYLAWRTGDGQPASEIATFNHNQRLRLQGRNQF
jgi:hypothetical protein